MNELDSRIQAALNTASELPEHIPEPTLSEELLETFTGRHEFLMKWVVIKALIAVSIMLFCAWQFFQQESTMAMIAYASMTIICAVGYAVIAEFIWVRMNHNTTIREIKRLEIQVALLTRALNAPPNRES